MAFHQFFPDRYPSFAQSLEIAMLSIRGLLHLIRSAKKSNVPRTTINQVERSLTSQLRIINYN